MNNGSACGRRALELELRADNARLAEAIEAEHGDGPQVQAAVDRSHQVMGELQKATLAHVFAMRALLHPDQAAKFDQLIVRKLTDAAVNEILTLRPVRTANWQRADARRAPDRICRDHGTA